MGAVIEVRSIATPIGALLVAERADVVLGAEFEDVAERLYTSLHRRVEGALELRVNAAGDTAVTRALKRYFDGDIAGIGDIAADPGGTPFQRRVWDRLRAIPAGETRCYGALAADLDRPKAARAVGRANGLNPIAVIIPCHRLVGADGTLTGYAGGLDRKAWLLRHEGLPNY